SAAGRRGRDRPAPRPRGGRRSFPRGGRRGRAARARVQAAGRGADGPIVMVGRDIGTVVLLNADVKVFLQASVEERAKRRHAERVGTDKETSLEAVEAALKDRDYIDSHRAASPLRPAEDAVAIDTDTLASIRSSRGSLSWCRSGASMPNKAYGISNVMMRGALRLSPIGPSPGGKTCQ
ncbi:Cytidylate kinase, partial [Geodia barretti]